jgi:hypothetical protein
MGFSLLEKLTIKAYSNNKYDKAVDKIKVMFNPESYSISCENVYQENPGINTSDANEIFTSSKGEELSLDIIFDGTGVSDFGIKKLVPAKVSDQVEQFLECTFYKGGGEKEDKPYYLNLIWGQLGEGGEGFKCRLTKAGIDYTLFDRSGNPLRAVIHATFKQAEEDSGGAFSPASAYTSQLSPEFVTHTREIQTGERLPLIAQDMYDDPSLYINVAKANGLSSIRRLEPGSELIFPPR